ncbi:hypothetical protein Tco_1251571, partial [Tanacetum coccineum]
MTIFVSIYIYLVFDLEVTRPGSLFRCDPFFGCYNLDAYDSDCDEISTAKAVLMANLSSYGSDVLFEVPISDNTHNDMLNQSVQEMPYFEPSHFVEHSENEIHSDSNIIMKKGKKPKKNDTEIALEKKVKELDNIVCKIGQSAQTVHMLTKPQVFYDNNLKQALGFQNSFYLKKLHRLANECMTLNRLSKDFGKCFVPQQKLSDEQAFRLQSSHPNTDQYASSPVKIEAPRELSKMEDAVQQYSVDKQCFEIQKKQFLIEKDRLLDQIISQDIVNIVVNSSVDMNTSMNMNSSVIMNNS